MKRLPLASSGAGFPLYLPGYRPPSLCLDLPSTDHQHPLPPSSGAAKQGTCTAGLWGTASMPRSLQTSLQRAKTSRSAALLQWLGKGAIAGEMFFSHPRLRFYPLSVSFPAPSSGSGCAVTSAVSYRTNCQAVPFLVWSKTEVIRGSRGQSRT